MRHSLNRIFCKKFVPYIAQRELYKGLFLLGLRRLGLNLAVCRREHILDKYSVAGCRAVYHNVRDGSDELAVLDDR